MTIKTILLISSILFAIQSQAQTLDVLGHADCSQLLQIEPIGTVGPTNAPEGAGKALEFNDNQLGDQQFIEKEHHTVWYKFRVPTTAEFTFELEPLDKNNDYDFALYKYTGEGFCEAVQNKELKPLRTNFSRNKKEIDSWTGLSLEAKNDYESSGVHPAYSKALSVLNGHEYVLLVDNVYPNGKGHLLHFKYRKSYSFTGKVRHLISKKPLPAALSLVNGKDKKSIAQFDVGEDGDFKIDFSIQLEQSKDSLILELKHPDYPTYTKVLDAGAILSLQGQPLICELGVPLSEDDLAYNERAFEFSGEVIDQNTGKPIQADVIATDIKTGNVIAETESDAETGKYTLRLKTDIHSPVHLEISKEGYFFKDTVLLPYKIPKETKHLDLSYKIKKLKKGAKFVVGNIIFHGDSPKPLDNSLPTIKALYKTMKMNKTLKIRIEGHTNGCGNGVPFSENLSQARTKTVLDFLVENGISPDRIKAQGFGCRRMLYSVSSRLNYLNRRVEIDILDL